MTLPFTPASAREVTLYYASEYDRLIAAGEIYPFLYPWGSAGAAIVLAYLLIDHRQSPFLRLLRFPVFGLLCTFAAWTVLYCRARNPASAFGVGLISGWSVLWIATILVLNDCQRDFRRIERQGGVFGRSTSEIQANGGPKLASSANGHATETRNGSINRQKPLERDTASSGLAPTQRKGSFTWQPYPTAPFVERLDWVADVFCNFRGVGWNWRISGLPPPPKWVQEQLRDSAGTPLSDEDTYLSRSTGVHRYHTRKDLLRRTARHLVIGYLSLDVLKTVVVHDAYFWTGQHSSPAPSFLPGLIKHSTVLLKSYRLLASLGMVYIALWTIFNLGPAFFCGLLGTEVIGARGEPWMYPDTFGGFRPVLDKGLAGWWGAWWHQTFRAAFEAPTTRILQATGIEKRSRSGKAIAVFVAFFLSGCLHACGSHTQMGDTRPLMGPMRFFLLQACGITAQTLVLDPLTKRTPASFHRFVNFTVVHVWFYYTAPLLVDDFARGGIWLFEPVPISLLRGLGFGAQGDSWVCWWDGLVQWHQGGHWWSTGIAL